MAVLGLRFCVWASTSCGERGLLFIAACGLLIVVASLVEEHGLQAHGLQQCGMQAQQCGSWALECRLSSCGAWAQLLRGMWDLPRPGLEPVSPALAGGFLITAPPGKSLASHFHTNTLKSRKCEWRQNAAFFTKRSLSGQKKKILPRTLLQETFLYISLARTNEMSPSQTSHWYYQGIII